MEAFINLVRKDPKVRVKINNTLDRYMRLPFNYQSKKGYDCLIQKVIPEELINIMGATKTHLDIELKMKISRINYLENKKHIYFCFIQMTIIYITEVNCQFYAVTYRNNNHFRVQKKEDIGNDKKIIYEVHLM